MTWIQQYLQYWKNTFNLKGLSTRSQFNTPIIINTLITLILLPLITKVFGKDLFVVANFWNIYIVTCTMSVLFVLVTMIPNFGMFYRRLKTVGKNEDFALFYALAPLLCFMWFFFMIIVGQGLSGDMFSIGTIIYLVILFGPIVYYIYNVIHLMFINDGQ
ncbi:hypothetical protein [Macrococcus sp. DPC7161]|uniref:hypothetical protein n=1 Tax=Macrococcus sp. DPC7161 TaxID=2507060 RepID=UPI00100B6776|nr:hypothetical protein [Macrococcus sp. DPC7161]RXK17892.1 hypothetical protein ER639_06845 [Macrococcus sp. DPC7161]